MVHKTLGRLLLPEHKRRFAPIVSTCRLESETGRIQFRRARFQTPSSVSCLALTVFWGEDSVSSSQPIPYLCEKANSPSFSQNSLSLLQNSVRSLFRNSTLETVFHQFPIEFSIFGPSPMHLWIATPAHKESRDGLKKNVLQNGASCRVKLHPLLALPTYQG